MTQKYSDIIIGSLVVIGLFFWWNQEPSTSGKSPHVQEFEKQDEKINQYFKHSHFKKELQEKMMAIENNETAPQYNDSPSQYHSQQTNAVDWGVHLNQEMETQQITQQLEKREREADGVRQISPEQVVLSELAQQMWLDTYRQEL